MQILVVEDDDLIAEGLVRLLRGEGYEVERVADGNQAVEHGVTRPVDLILLDVILPGLNGYQVCAAIRARGDWTPILMLTAKGGEYDEAEGLETGADDYLVKPTSTVVLLARVRALLRRPRRRLDWPSVNGLRLDPLRRRCLVDGSSVELTSRETEVLAVLLDRPDEVHSKSDLLAQVWGDGFVGDPNIVEVYVSHLRRKLDEPFGRQAIETIRGIGYRVRSQESE